MVESTPPLIPSTNVFRPDSRKQDWMKLTRRSISACTESGPVNGAQTLSAVAISCWRLCMNLSSGDMKALLKHKTLT